MPGDQLNVTLIQPDIVWEDRWANLEQYEKMLDSVKGKKEIVVLPEMFSTGFSMAPERLAEPMDGATVGWMKEMAARHRCILTGSLIIQDDDDNYYNRMLWVQPNGHLGYYDKRHLFAFGHEDDHYCRGEKRVIAQVNGWRICLQVCYDLRFPVWARNQGEEYDVLIYVANWPEVRNLAWKTLLQARAIENQSYVIGVNRVGTDGKKIYYSGDSSAFGPLGELMWQESHRVSCHTVTLEKEVLHKVRTELPFLKDRDNFILI